MTLAVSGENFHSLVIWSGFYVSQFRCMHDFLSPSGPSHPLLLADVSEIKIKDGAKWTTNWTKYVTSHKTYG